MNQALLNNKNAETVSPTLPSISRSPLISSRNLHNSNLDQQVQNQIEDDSGVELSNNVDKVLNNSTKHHHVFEPSLHDDSSVQPPIPETGLTKSSGRRKPASGHKSVLVSRSWKYPEIEITGPSNHGQTSTTTQSGRDKSPVSSATKFFPNPIQRLSESSLRSPNHAAFRSASFTQSDVNALDYLSTGQYSDYTNYLLTKSLSDNLSSEGTGSIPVFADEEEAFSMDSEKLKVRFLSAWNNVKNGWTFGKRTASFSSPFPIWLLGVKYESRGSSSENLENQDVTMQTNIDPEENGEVVLETGKPLMNGNEKNPESVSKIGRQNGSPLIDRKRSNSLGEEVTEQSSVLLNFPAFKRDFQSRIWFTYRKDFPPLPETKSTSDTGWGCMLRSGQMMLGQALILHLLQRDWRFEGRLSDQQTYLRILRLFDDSVGSDAPFSLHTLVTLGKETGKSVGDWYGPSSVAYVLRDALFRAKQNNVYPELQNLCIYVAQDCTIYKNDVLQQCFSSDEDAAVIILVPVRLGGDYFNPSYSSLIQELFHSENCLGIIGGKPRHSLYFVGYQKEKLLYLDPHFCQQIVDTRGEYFPTESFRCEYPRKMSIGKMDPSCTLGFYCRDRNDFMKFCFQMTPTSLQRGVYPMFVISSSSYEAVMNTISLMKSNKKEKILRVHHLDSDGNATTQCEDFVFLEVNKNGNSGSGKHSAASASS